MKKKYLFIATSLLLVSCNTPNPVGPTDSHFPSESTSTNQSPTDVESTPSVDTLKEAKVYMVGDSTVCSFEDEYYYPRYGYGTQLHKYLKEEASVVNLALSGRSSKSFLEEENYQTLKDSISEGDYLLIGFGHNDEKTEEGRYTNPNTSITEDGSFKKSLYDNYIKIAQDNGATPILLTPVVRLSTSNDYGANNNTHVTTGADGFPGGDYSKAIKELAEEVNVDCIDLTTSTKALYSELGFEEAKKLHAWLTSDPTSVDKTHLNIYGATMTSYLIANELSTTDSTLKEYLVDEIVKPVESEVLVSNPNYVEPDYLPPSQGGSTFASTEPWWTSVFGDAGGASKINTTNFAIDELDTPNSVHMRAGVVDVENQTTTTGVGKISGSAGDGLVMYFRQIEADANFEISATMKINYYKPEDNQVGFGLMLRDDMYIDEHLGSLITGNYVAAGATNMKSATTAIFSKVAGKLGKDVSATNAVAKDDVITVSIKRQGNVITCTYNDQTHTYTDFDLTGIDANYDYVGLFVSRACDVTFSEILYK